MNDDVITDLKQFIATTVSQEIHRLGEQLEQRIDGVEHRLEDKIDNLSAFVVEALDIANETAGEQFQNHERRIVKLEKAAI